MTTFAVAAGPALRGSGLHLGCGSGSDCSRGDRLAPPQDTATSSRPGQVAATLAASICAAAAASSRPARRSFRGRARLVARRASTQLDASGPLPFVKLSNGSDEATVYLRGASVASYKASGVEWLALRADAKLDGSKPNISGGLPICFPQFGPGDPVPQHGFARNMDWKLLESESQDGTCVLELTDTEETRKVWPHEFRCLYRVELKDDQLVTTLSVDNRSASECTFTCGLHSYYHVSDIDELKILGKFEGCTKMDRNLDPPQPISYDKGEIVISDWTDDIYKKVLPGSVVLSDPGKGELAIVSGGGWRDVVVWNPYKDDKVGYKNFVCVESVECDTISVAAGGSWEATMSLVPKNK